MGAIFYISISMQNTQKSRVLITNDDGVNSANIHALAGALAPFGEVFVFAPETEQSGVSQAFTVRKGIRVQKGSSGQYEVYSVSGTPADAAKFAIGCFAAHGFSADPAANEVPGSHFDVCFSGVNVGENSGVSSLYSGTVAGAREAALWGVPAVALSLCVGGESLMPAVLDFAVHVVRDRLYAQMPPNTFWNVNFPKSKDGTFKGVRATKMALGMFTDHYDRLEGVSGLDGVWQLDGEKLWEKEPVDSDDYVLHQGYATLTPHRIDQTDVESLNRISEMIEGGCLMSF